MLSIYFFWKEPSRRAAGYIKKKMKNQIRQYARYLAQTHEEISPPNHCLQVTNLHMRFSDWNSSETVMMDTVNFQLKFWSLQIYMHRHLLCLLGSFSANLRHAWLCNILLLVFFIPSYFVRYWRVIFLLSFCCCQSGGPLYAANRCLCLTDSWPRQRAGGRPTPATCHSRLRDSDSLPSPHALSFSSLFSKGNKTKLWVP